MMRSSEAAVDGPRADPGTARTTAGHKGALWVTSGSTASSHIPPNVGLGMIVTLEMHVR